MNQPPKFDLPLTLSAQIRARAENEDTRTKTMLIHEGRRWSYEDFRNESVRTAHFLRGRLGASDDKRPAHVAMLLDNHLEQVALLGGAGLAGATLFGINTGLRGETLAGVINQAGARVVVVDESYLPEIDRVRDRLTTVAQENILVLSSSQRVASNPGITKSRSSRATSSGTTSSGATSSSSTSSKGPSAGPSASLSDPQQDFLACMADEVGADGGKLEFPDFNVTPETNLMVIYTSGTTGLPKGINNNHLKICAVGMRVSSTVGVTSEDVGYISMPLFHSNSIFVGLMPAFWVGGSVAIRERFSASAFMDDVLRYRATYWNYVGEPVHYVLAALAERFGGDLERLRAELTEHPDNRMRFAVGNGASPPDIDRFVEWFGLEDMFELYGSTEAAISTFRRRGDPRGSVGEILDADVKILDDHGVEKPPAELDRQGRILNYDDAVGEICRVADAGLFQGYFANKDATESKYRDGVYHSGDLGHILIRDERRYLFFDGRTDDWIRKDGENFSALQVARFAAEHPHVVLAAAYGVPCSVSDELVMVALKLGDGVTFDPQAFFDFCEQQVVAGGMDRKWFPDFVRVVDDFEYTGTQKILVRHLKAVHYDPSRVDDPLYWRERGDRSFRRFTSDDFELLRGKFAQAERSHLLGRD